MSDVAQFDDFEDMTGDAFVDDEDLAAPEPEVELAPVSVEARARAMGWKPLPVDPRNVQPNEYRGDPRYHRDAAEFIEHGERELPVLRDNNKRMSEKLARLEPEVATLRNTIAEQAAAIKRATTLAERADEAGYRRGLTELEGQRRAAVETGDTVAFDQVQAQIDTLVTKRTAETAPVVEPPAPAAPAAREETWPETSAFIAANPTIMNDTVLRNAMIRAHGAIIDVFPNLSRADQYERAKQQVMEAHPDKFPRPPAAELEPEYEDEPLAREPDPAPAPRARAPAPRAAVLAPSAPQPAGNGRRSVWEQVPAEERDAAREGYRKSLMMDPDQPPSEFVALYMNKNLNPLDLRARRKKA